MFFFWLNYWLSFRLVSVVWFSNVFSNFLRLICNNKSNQENKNTALISKYTLFWTPDLIQMTTDQCNAGGVLQPFDWGNKDQMWGLLRTRGTQSEQNWGLSCTPSNRPPVVSWGFLCFFLLLIYSFFIATKKYELQKF